MSKTRFNFGWPIERMGWLVAGVAICAGMIATSCGQRLEQTDQIRFNQLGFYPSEVKTAVVMGEPTTVGTFSVRDLTSGKVVWTGQLSEARSSAISGKPTTVLSFSELTNPGEYVLEVPGIGKSAPFHIREHAMRDVATAALKAFYYQRMGMPIEEKYAGKWNRPAGHSDEYVKIHPSAASADRPEGKTISSPKGWYDAGDYNKYIVNSGFTVSVLLSLYEDYPGYVKHFSTHIPETGNGVPDLLNEAYWNLSWMLTMQDPEDGGVYHKLTTPKFEAFIKPTECKQQRYVVAKSVTATLDFAATMAQASRIYANYYANFPGVSKNMLQAAKDAFRWAMANPDVLYSQRVMNEKYDPDISTGEYGDRNASDEFFWAASELYVTTGDQVYLETLKRFKPSAYVNPVWGRVYGLGNLTLIRYADKVKDKELADEMRTQLIAYTDSCLVDYANSSYNAPYGRVAKDFFWGCNSDGASNQGMGFLHAYKLTQDKKYLEAAIHNLDYVLGRNATGYCYVTGFGTKSPMYPHHRLSATDEIVEPLPGFLIGGSNPGKQDKCEYPSDIPDECYADVEASYASNEIAINWQALFTYLVIAVDASIP